MLHVYPLAGSSFHDGEVVQAKSGDRESIPEPDGPARGASGGGPRFFSLSALAARSAGFKG